MASALVAKVQASSGNALIAAGRSYSLLIGSDRSLWAWGANWSGQLGDGTTTNRSTPTQVLTGVADVAGGLYHTLALKTDGSLWTWGYNGYGQLCRGDEYWPPGFQAPGMDNEVYALAPSLFIQSPGMVV